MSTTQHPVIMQSSLALGRLELPPGSAAVTPRPPAKDACVQRPVVPQGPAHLNGCVPLTHQVAGHKYGVDKVGILQHPDGTVLKQLQPPPRGPREMQFYSMVFTADCSDPCLLELQNHLPKYYGTWSSPDCPNDLYLKLEDVTRRFVKPCIMDVKLGQRSYDPYASQDKREQQIRKYPLMEDIGFLVLGMRVYKVCNDSFDSYDQHYGRGLLKDTIKDGLATFFHNGVSLRKDAVWASMRRVQRILHWFESQTQLTFYASSLLFVYEGLPSSPSPLPPSIQPSLTAKAVMMSSTGDGAGDHEGKCVEEGAGQGELAEHNNNNNIQVCDYSLASRYTKHAKAVSHCANAVETSVSSGVCEDNSPYNGNGNRKALLEEREGEGGGEGLIDRSDGASEVEVRMIDFAHVFPSEGHDRGYIYGLKHLLTVLEQILCDAA